LNEPKPELAVCCRGIVKEFGSGQALTRVLRGVDLDVRFGERTFLVGQSGCGKTTLISIIAGLLAATEGSLNVLGEDLGKLRGGRLVDFRSRNLGFVFQQFNLLPSLNAAENAAVPLIGQGIAFSKAVKLATNMLEKLEMGAHARKYPCQLSGGQQQRVAIARALLHEPKIVICDEPTASLDAEAGKSVMTMLSTMAAAKERAVIIVTHDTRIFSFADRIAYMADGRINQVESGELLTKS
jgi:putative ABC transport system ATP-binding protein